MRRLLFISSLLLTFICHAQVDSLATDSTIVAPVDSVQSDSSRINIADSLSIVEKDSSFINARLFTPSIYIDYGKLLTIPTDFETKYEGGIELLIKERFQLIGEIGMATITPEGAYSNGTYESDGMYYRVGLGFIGRRDAKSNIGISARYASSTFDETGRIFIESASGVQENFVLNINRTGLTAQWWELMVYTDQRLLKESDLLWLGLNLRLRVLYEYDEQEAVDVYAIPGYGRTFDKTIPAANFFIKVKF